MATSKTAKVESEIEKVKAKMAEFQAKLRELEQKKTEIENSEIVSMVRGIHIDLNDLAAFLQSYRSQPQEDVLDNLSRTAEAAPESTDTPTASTIQYNGDSGEPDSKTGSGQWT